MYNLLLRLNRMLVVLMMTVISACTTLGPNYIAPEVAKELDWLESQDKTLASDKPVDPLWWRSAFQDDTLDKLVSIALAENLTLRSAGLRVLQAQENLRIATGAQFPTQVLRGGIGRTGLATSQASDGVDRNFYSDELGFGLQWEADVWGRFQRQVESASAQLDVSVASYDGVLLSLLAQVSQTYLNIRTLEERERYLRDNIVIQQQSLTIAEDRFEGGLVTELDQDQARSLLYNTQASLGDIQVSLVQLRNTLSLLLGQSPGEVITVLSSSSQIPETPAQIALGMPQDLIRRRPDIRQAERRLAAQSALVGFAITDLYPTFTLGGSIGFESTDTGGNDLSDVFTSDTRSWDLGAGFNWNVFNYGRIKGNIRLQDALFQQLMTDYQNTVLNAQAEIESAIIAYLVSQQQLGWYIKSEQAARNAVDIANVQYDDGLVDFNTVVTNLLTLRTQQDLLASSRGQVAVNLVGVFKALGGGWEIYAGKTVDQLIPNETKDIMRKRTKYWDGVLE